MTDSLPTDSFILTYKVIFSEHGTPKKMLDAGGNFVSEKIKDFCRNLNIEEAVSSSYHHQSNGQVEASNS